MRLCVGLRNGNDKDGSEASWQEERVKETEIEIESGKKKKKKMMEGENERKQSDLMISTLGLFSPLKKWLLRSVLTTSLSTVNWTFLQNSLCSSGLMDSLKNAHQHQAEIKSETHETEKSETSFQSCDCLTRRKLGKVFNAESLRKLR